MSTGFFGGIECIIIKCIRFDWKFHFLDQHYKGACIIFFIFNWIYSFFRPGNRWFVDRNTKKNQFFFQPSIEIFGLSEFFYIKFYEKFIIAEIIFVST